VAVIVVVGMPGSGKDVLIEAATSLGYQHIRMGDVVRRFAKLENIKQDDASIGGFANKERENYGDNIWALRTLAIMPSGDSVIDGSRSLAEISEFKKVFGSKLTVIGIRVPSELRFQRLMARKRSDDPNTLKDFEARDNREISWGILEALQNADFVLDNDGELKYFRKKCIEILASIKSSNRKSI
jgi:dephospho-CoA kinase